MKPTRLLAMSAALVGCSVACGMYVLGKHGSHSAALETAPSRSKFTADSKGGQHSAASSAGAKHRQQLAGATGGTAPSHECHAPARKVVGNDPATQGPVLSEAQWRANAEQVERESNHELKRLSSLLDLDPVQQDKVFSSLVQNSPYYLPGMRNGGLAKTSDPGASSSAKPGASSDTGSTPENGALAAKASDGTSTPEKSSALNSYLNADQQDLLAQEEAEREEWWSEVLPQLLPPSVVGDETATPALTGTPESGDPPADTKEYTGDDVLIEE